jgi:hypothetical protein
LDDFGTYCFECIHNALKLQQKARPTSSLPFSIAVAGVPIIEKTDPQDNKSIKISIIYPSMVDQSRMVPNPIKPIHYYDHQAFHRGPTDEKEEEGRS